MDNNDIYQQDLARIERDKKCKPNCCNVIGITGPTHTLWSESKCCYGKF